MGLSHMNNYVPYFGDARLPIVVNEIRRNRLPDLKPQQSGIHRTASLYATMDLYSLGMMPRVS